MKCPSCRNPVVPRRVSPPNEMRSPGQGFEAFAVECSTCGVRGPVNFDESPSGGLKDAENSWTVLFWEA
jgi:hypothetical protein